MSRRKSWLPDDRPTKHPHRQGVLASVSECRGSVRRGRHMPRVDCERTKVPIDRGLTPSLRRSAELK
jgi:hypothetical protein